MYEAVLLYCYSQEVSTVMPTAFVMNPISVLCWG